MPLTILSSTPRNRAGWLLMLLFTLPVAVAAPIQTERLSLTYEIVTEGLRHPWSLAFLPGGDMLVSERRGQLRRVTKTGRLQSQSVKGLPPIQQHGQGGLLDIALHPDFDTNRLVYFSYAESDVTGAGTTVARGRLEKNTLQQPAVLFRLAPKTGGGRHFGSRLVFDRDGLLYITLGDRGQRQRAQRLNDHAGSLVRVTDDGEIPPDNPFVGRDGINPEIYSYGHRNIQGAALHPQSGQLWIHEHGPQGGDEINIPGPGVNHGWPVITYGVNYGTGSKIGEGTHKPGMAQPVHYWVPSIAPSGMTFYDAEPFSAWKGDLLVGSLKFEQLVRLELDGTKVTHEERMLEGKFGRIRDVRQGPDGLIYLLTDEYNGKLIRLLPATGG